MSPKLRAAWDRGQRGWPERYPVAQFPNAPLIVFLVAKVLGLDTLAMAGLVVWAALELLSGVNLLRRGLGAVVLASVVAGTVAG